MVACSTNWRALAGGWGARPVTTDAVWTEGDHPRGQPDNKGQFVEKGARGGARAKPARKTAKSKTTANPDPAPAMPKAPRPPKGLPPSGIESSGLSPEAIAQFEETSRSTKFETDMWRRQKVGAQTLQFYHGTAADAEASILKEGLVPSHGGGADDWSERNGGTVQKFSVGDRAASVFVSESRDEAEAFANLAAHEHRCKAALFKVEIPAREIANVWRDELAPDLPGAFRFKGRIKPEWISLAGEAKRFDTPFGSIGLDADGARTVYLVVLCKPGEDADVAGDARPAWAALLGLDEFDPDEARNDDGEWVSVNRGTHSTPRMENVRILRNPDPKSLRDFVRAMKQARLDRGQLHDEAFTDLRILKDDAGKFAVWDADDAIHDQIASGLGLKGNWYTESQKHIPIFTAKQARESDYDLAKIYGAPIGTFREAEMKRAVGAHDEERGWGTLLALDDFNPSEARVPAGGSGAGEWTKGGANPSTKKASGKAKEAPAADPATGVAGKSTKPSPAPAAAASAAKGKGSEPPPKKAETFVSPNVENIDFRAAHEGLYSQRQLALLAASHDIDAGLGLTARDRSAIGAWSDGAENSVMTEYTGADFAAVKAAAVMKAHLADQKQVLVFGDDEKGPHVLFHFDADGDISEIHRQLLADGIPFHTLVPKGGGARVYVADQDGSMLDAVEKAAKRYDAQLYSTRGTAEFIGDSPPDGDTRSDRAQRDEALSAYRRAIDGSGNKSAQAVWKRVLDAYGSNLKRPLALSEAERNLTAHDIFDPEKTTPKKVGSRRVEEIAAELERRGKAALRALGVKGGSISYDTATPEQNELIARAIAAEVDEAMDRAGAKTAKDWYSTKVSEGMAVAALIHPEIAHDENARAALRMAMAITSQGETVPSNLRLAEAAYAYYKEHGLFPTDVKSKEQVAMNTNFGKCNRLIEKLGISGARAFLDKEDTVRKILGQSDLHGIAKISGANVGKAGGDEPTLYGSAIFGQKIGQGFYQNLGGNFDPVTMDLWFMRAVGRLTGDLVGQKDPEEAAKTRGRLTGALAAEGQKVPKTDVALANIADKIFSQHERDYKKYRADYDSGARVKSELVKAAERYLVSKAGVRGQPSSGGERTWLRGLAGRAISLLGAEGHARMTPADMQAFWWYPEKKIYETLGGKKAPEIDDYAAAFSDMARARGVSDEAIKKAIEEADE